MRTTQLLSALLVSFPLAACELSPFFDPNTPNEIRPDGDHNVPRRLKELKFKAIQRRLQKSKDKNSKKDSSDDKSSNHRPGLGKKRGKEMFKGNSGNNDGHDHVGDNEDVGLPCSCHYDENDFASGDVPCDCNEQKKPNEVKMEFVMVRNEVGTPIPQEKLGITSSIGMNGYTYELVHKDGENTHGNVPTGNFKGLCTVTSEIDDKGALLCTYEINMYTSGPHSVATVMVKGPISGGLNKLIVTGAEYDFSPYTGGHLKLEQSTKLPILFAHLTLA